MRDGILRVEFLNSSSHHAERFFGSGWPILQPKGARLHVRWNGVERTLLVSRERGEQALGETLR